jgi:hypothetical protein
MRTAIPLLALLAVAPLRALAAPAPVTIVFCAPGYPGSTAEAQPSMDAFAAAVAAAAGWPAGSVRAVYEATEQAGLERLGRRDSGVALTPLPFFLKHAAALKLAPRLGVEAQGKATETWSLVAKKGRLASPAALAGMTVSSIAGYAPEFVRGAVAGWGRLPADAKVVESSQVLSALRKAASGGDVALLLDGSQAAALPTLPFAGELEVVARAGPLRFSPGLRRSSRIESPAPAAGPTPAGPAAPR